MNLLKVWKELNAGHAEVPYVPLNGALNGACNSYRSFTHSLTKWQEHSFSSRKAGLKISQIFALIFFNY